jgi:hypothetical protein
MCPPQRLRSQAVGEHDVIEVVARSLDAIVELAKTAVGLR